MHPDLSSCTFQPKIDQRSRLIAELDPNLPGQFQDRIRYYQERRQQRHAEREIRYERSSQLTFQPAISTDIGKVLERSGKSHILTESYLDKARGSEDEQQIAGAEAKRAQESTRREQRGSGSGDG